jgi:hypothetical protein|tara:strand:- start:116 stop:406 length:291 start_codon:yes stop_codon:yes gene_type:complete
MVTPTLITRTDYRVYEIATQFPSSYYKEHLNTTEKAIDSYLLDRDIDYQEIRESRPVKKDVASIEYRIIKFKNLSDSQMFSLALAPYITNGSNRYD